MAERYEILEIARIIKAGRYKLENIPATYRLGTGHKKFFYNKLKYCKERYEALHQEALKRGFNVQYFNTFEELDILHPELFNDYSPSLEELEVSRACLQGRIDAKPHIFGEYTVKID